MNVLMTGGSGGIGREVLWSLLDSGHTVTTPANGRDPESVFGDICSLSRLKVMMTFDAIFPHKCKNLVDYAWEQMGSIDVFINCMGSWSDQRVLDEDHFTSEIFEDNVISVIHLTREILLRLESEKHSSHLVYLTGSTGGSLTHPMYSASKAALIDYIESVKFHCHQLRVSTGINILVSKVAPPPTATKIWESALHGKVDTSGMADPRDSAKLIVKVIS